MTGLSKRYKELAEKINKFLSHSKVPLKQNGIADLVGCHFHEVAYLKSIGQIDLPLFSDRAIDFVEEHAKQGDKIYQIRAQLQVGPVKMYDYVYRALGKEGFDETPLNRRELSELLSHVSEEQTERLIARMVLHLKSIEEICKATKLNHETIRKSIKGIGLYSTREAMKEELGKEKLYSGITKRLSL